jgi:hypothetical protein
MIGQKITQKIFEKTVDKPKPLCYNNKAKESA